MFFIGRSFYWPCECEDPIMKKSSRRIAAALFVAFLLVTTPLEAQAQLKPEPVTKLTLGVVFQGSRDSVTEHFRPLVNYAARKLTPTGAKGMVVVASTAAQMTKLLEEKRVDFYMESPLSHLCYKPLGCRQAIAQTLEGGHRRISQPYFH
jgi:ABC-type phosphate/phosphonate transport system substrate-binding protein